MYNKMIRAKWVNCNDHKEGSVVSFFANNEIVHQSRVFSCPLDAGNIRPESSEESDDSAIEIYENVLRFVKKLEDGI